MPSLILASGSPRRAQLLRGAGLEFAVIAPHAVELEVEHLTPHETAQVNAYRKARTVAKHHPDALVLAADTVVCLGERLFGKPASLTEARRMLAELQGRTHEVITGVCLLARRQHWQRMFAVSSLVTLRELEATSIREYLSRVNPLDKAGGYAIQEEGYLIIEAVDGSFTNIVGLPLKEVLREMREFPR